MGNYKELVSKFGFATAITILGLVLLINSMSGNQNNLVSIASLTITCIGILIGIGNSGLLSVKAVKSMAVTLILCSMFFAWLDYRSVQTKLEFLETMEKREGIVVEKLIDIRAAQLSYKKVHGEFAVNFDQLINHVKNDSMPIVRAMGSVPDTLTEMKAVELGIVTRDTMLISVRDTLFPAGYSIDSLRYVPNSGGKEFVMQAGEIEKNKMIVKVFEVFASNDKILHGLDLSEEYVNPDDGLRVGSMTDPHTRGNWE